MKKAAAILAVSVVLLAILWAISNRQPTSHFALQIIGEDSSSLQAMEAIKASFEASSGISVAFNRLPFDAALEKSNNDLSLGTGQYDIICQYAASLAPYVNNKYVLMLDEMDALVPRSTSPREFEADLFPGVWRETGFFKPIWSDKAEKVSYPFAATTMVLVYRKSMFESLAAQERFRDATGRKLQVPTTWEDYLTAARAFTDPQAGTYGVVMEGAPGGFLYWEWTNYAFGMGGGVARKDAGWEGDIDTQFVLASPETIAATELYLKLKPYNLGDYLSISSAEKRELFVKNKVAMSIMWSDYVPDLLRSPEADDFGFTVIPGPVSMLGGATFFVNRRSKHQRESVLYILSLMNHPTQVDLMKRGMASPFRSTYEDQEVQKIPYAASFKNSLERGVYMIEAGADSQLVQDAITEAVQGLWIKGGDVQARLTDVQNKIIRDRANLFRK